MKHIIISIKPEWVCKILNKEKLLEIRKSVPKEILNGEECIVEIYCTKDRNNLFIVNQNDSFIYKTTNIKCCHLFGDGYFGNGKVVARWHLKQVDLLVDCGMGVHYCDKDYNLLDLDYLRINSCLTDEQIYLYLGLKKDSGYYNDGYAWHIEDLHIYDTPKELAEFGLKRPFQSWGYLNDE